MKTTSKSLPETSQPPGCMSVSQFAEKLNVSVDKAWRLIWQRQVATVRIGRRVVVPFQAYEAYVKRHTVPAVEAKI